MKNEPKEIKKERRKKKPLNREACMRSKSIRFYIKSKRGGGG